MRCFLRHSKNRLRLRLRLREKIRTGGFMSMKELLHLPGFELFLARVKERRDEDVRDLISEGDADRKTRLQGQIQGMGWVIELADELAREEEEEGEQLSVNS